MILRLRSSLFFLCAAILTVPNAHAGLEDTARKGAEGIRKAVQYTAEQIDITLAGKRYTDHANDSRATLSQLVNWTEGGVVRTSTDFGVNLRLPNVEKHWQLRFSTYDEEKEERNLTQRRVRNAPREREYGTSLFFLRKLGDVKITFQPRLQLKNPLDMSYVLKFTSAAAQKRFRIEPKLELFADATKGTGEYFSLAFVYQLRKTLELAFESEEEYTAKDHSFTTRHGLTLDYAHSKRDGFGTAVVVSSANHNFHLTNITYNVQWSHIFYKDLLVSGLSPYLAFDKSNRFKGKAGISFILTALF